MLLETRLTARRIVRILLELQGLRRVPVESIMLAKCCGCDTSTLHDYIVQHIPHVDFNQQDGTYQL